MAVCKSPYGLVLLAHILLFGLVSAEPLLGILREAEKETEDRLIPPFSPSLEMARSLGSSPETPQGKESPTLENPREASLNAIDDQFTEDSQVVPGDSESQDIMFDRAVSLDHSEDLVDDEEEEASSLGDLEEEEEEGECPPHIPKDYTLWRRSIKVVRATLPHQVFSSCTPPLRCSVTTTVHRRVYLQDGDTLEVLLQTPPDYTPPPPSRPPLLPPSPSSSTTTQQQQSTLAPSPSPQNPPTTTTTTTTTTQVLGIEKNTTTTQQPASSSQHPPQEQHQPSQPPAQQQDNPQQPSQSSSSLSEQPNPQGNSTHLFSRVDHPAHTPEEPRRMRRTVGRPSTPLTPALRKKKEESGGGGEESQGGGGGGEKDGNQTATSPLTIWKASVAEWASCSTREGSQVGESGDQGVVTVAPKILQVGNSYFIGRSSWSSTECFKLQVTVRSAECGEGSLCSGKGVCYAKPNMEHYQCECCQGYIGTHCEERDACRGDPCLNAGICVDIQEGHDGDTFQCLCPYGYRGRYCEERTNLCESGPCKNGATCTGNHSSYSCHCPSGWSGPQCMERSRNDGAGEEVTGCDAGPCVHGVCVDTSTHGIRCFCQPGFGGQRCEFEYDECDSNPCTNGGTCVDHIGGYECLCGRGYTGTRCEIKYDLCSPNPCPPSLVCVDKGNSFSCECLSGFTEDNCGPHPQFCTPNPCDNGGTCWNLPDPSVFFCACRPGFTGTTCQGILQEGHDEAILETVGAVGTVESVPLDVHIPMETPLDHMKNIYVAIATLAAALLIFILVVGVCHCRVNRTYRKFLMKIPRPRKVMPTVKRPRPTSLFEKPRRGDRSGALRLEAEPDGASMPMTASNSNSDAVYYNMDVCDNQELPLIK